MNESRICVEDLPININKEGQITPSIDAEFLRHFFRDYDVDPNHDSIFFESGFRIDGPPYSKAFVRFKTHDQALKAIKNLNYTKILDNIICLYLADEETLKIIQSNKWRLLVQNLDPTITDSQLFDAFSYFGEVIYSKILKSEIIENGEKKMISHEYGYVQFRHPEDAKRALTDLKDASINGRAVIINELSPLQAFQPKKTAQPEISEEDDKNTIFVRNLHYRASKQEISEFFSEHFGKVKSVRIIKKTEHGKRRSRGFGFVVFEDFDACQKALDIKEIEFKERLLKIELAKPRNANDENNEKLKEDDKSPIPKKSSKKIKKPKTTPIKESTSDDDDDDSFDATPSSKNKNENKSSSDDDTDDDYDDNSKDAGLED